MIELGSLSYGFGEGDPLELGCAAILINDAIYKKSTDLGIINVWKCCKIDKFKCKELYG